MRLLGEQRRADVRTLYGVLRTIDDLVDEDDPRAPERVAALERWARGGGGGRADSPEAHALSALAERHPLPREQLLEFCRRGCATTSRAQRSPTTRTSTATASRPAARSGSCSPCCSAPRARTKSAPSDGMAALGRAMQVTNILRDIDEDLATRRVYISQSAIERFGFPAPGAREELLRDHIARADALYEEGLPAIALLARGREAMALSAALYREILRQIERDGLRPQARPRGRAARAPGSSGQEPPAGAGMSRRPTASAKDEACVPS